MARNSKSLLANLAVTAVMLASAGFFGWQFYDKFTGQVENAEGLEVGKVAVVQGQAERRYARQTRWGSVRDEDSVFNLDAIRTSSESGAVIELLYTDESGEEHRDEISLGPDTYIVLDLLGETRNIQFVGGDISASGSEGLTVSAGNTVVSVDAGLVSLGRLEGEETNVTVVDGQARVNTAAGETVVGTEQGLRINESSGTAERVEVAVSIAKPRNNALLLTYGRERRVDFAWNLFAEWNAPRVEVSQDAEFNEASSPVFRAEGADSASMVLPPARWFWRIVDGSTGESGPVSLFTVDQERTVQPVSPAENAVIPFRGENSSVNLQWQNAWFADSYTIEMGRTRDFVTPLVSRETTSGSVLVQDLDDGEWWWRIIPEYRRGILDGPPSAGVRSFVMERRTGHDPPKLISPANDVSLSALDVRDGIDFRWQSRADLVDYRIEVATDENFDSPAAISEAPENWRKLLTAPEPNTYYWRVSATAADGLPVPVSEVRRFAVREVTGSVELVDPAPGEVKELEPYAPHTFVWRSGVPGTARFVLLRANGGGTDDRMRIIESMVNGETFTAPMPGEGSYVWQVQILDAGGRMIVESPEARFRLRSEFSSPVLNDPRPGSSVSLVGSTSIAMSWDPAAGADAYRVILKGPDGTAIGRDDRVEGLEREFPLPGSVGPGGYSVELASLRDNPPAGASRISEPAVYRFEIGNLVRYQAAVPTSPADGARIGALDAISRGVTLRWTQNPSLGRWTVELDNGRITRLYRTTEPALVLENLDAGDYTWTIRSNDSFGQQAPDSRASRFSVAGLPTPTVPVVTSPQAGETVDMTGRSELDFAWQSVPGADFYDLTLYAEGSDIPLLRETGLTGNRFVLRDLRVLDVGRFILAITARAEYEDVGVTRTSIERRVPFALSLNIADRAPTILTDELQYAE